MIQTITGKTLIFSDLHIGLSGNKVTKLNIVINVIREILKYIKQNKIKNVLFLGDWNHSRVISENNTLNISYKLISALTKQAHVTMLLGNHDIYYKNSVDVNSLVVFESLNNIDIIKQPTEIDINNKKCLLVPWLGDLSKYNKSEFDLMMGHFEVSAKYLIRSYVEDHSNITKSSELISKMIDNDNIINSLENQSNVSLDKTIDEAVKSNSKAGEFLGSFVEIVKQNGKIFSGHIHTRREFLAKKRNFVFVGSPYQQNKGEIENRCGFYILNEDGSHEFHEISAPKYILIKTSEVIKAGIDNFDFGIVKGNIVQKIYDKEIDKKTEAIMNQRITDLKPYEEMIPEYEVSLDQISSSVDMENEQASLIRKSKLEYIKNYIDNIDKKVLEEQKIEPETLYKILETYYNMVTEA